jgi:hypothetical protein
MGKQSAEEAEAKVKAGAGAAKVVKVVVVVVVVVETTRQEEEEEEEEVFMIKQSEEEEPPTAGRRRLAPRALGTRRYGQTVSRRRWDPGRGGWRRDETSCCGYSHLHEPTTPLRHRAAAR